MKKAFTDKEFKEKMLKADTDTLIDFLDKDFLIFDEEGNVVGEIDIVSEIDKIYNQISDDLRQCYWNLIKDL